MMIKRASGDWLRRIPPWVDIHVCDLRRYRGPYTGRKHHAARRARAITDIYRALAKARRCAWEVLVIRLGEPTPRRDALHSLVRLFVGSPVHEDIICIAEPSLPRQARARAPTASTAQGSGGLRLNPYGPPIEVKVASGFRDTGGLVLLGPSVWGRCAGSSRTRAAAEERASVGGCRL